MGFGDRFRRAMGISALSEADQRWLPFRAALDTQDEAKCLELAFALMRGQHFDEALRAFEAMEKAFPEKRGEWLRWQGQTLYIGLGLRAADPAAQRALHERALECYLRAAEAGDRTQEFNAVELCEHLAREELAVERKRELFDRYLALFPQGPGRAKVERLRAALG